MPLGPPQRRQNGSKMEPKWSQKGAKWGQMEPQGEPKGAKLASLDAPGTPQDAPDTPLGAQGIQNGAKMETNEPNGINFGPGRHN